MSDNDEHKSEDEDVPSTEEKPEEPPPPQWEFKKEFAIHTKLKEVVRASLDVSNAELDQLRRKLDKLTYGS